MDRDPSAALRMTSEDCHSVSDHKGYIVTTIRSGAIHCACSIFEAFNRRNELRRYAKGA